MEAPYHKHYQESKHHAKQNKHLQPILAYAGPACSKVPWQQCRGCTKLGPWNYRQGTLRQVISDDEKNKGL